MPMPTDPRIPMNTRSPFAPDSTRTLPDAVPQWAGGPTYRTAPPPGWAQRPGVPMSPDGVPDSTTPSILPMPGQSGMRQTMRPTNPYAARLAMYQAMQQRRGY